MIKNNLILLMKNKIIKSIFSVIFIVMGCTHLIGNPIGILFMDYLNLSYPLSIGIDKVIFFITVFIINIILSNEYNNKAFWIVLPINIFLYLFAILDVVIRQGQFNYSFEINYILVLATVLLFILLRRIIQRIKNDTK